MRGRSFVGHLGAFGVLTMAIGLTTAAAQTPAPSIAFLNPSSFATAGERGIIISDQSPSAGPGCCELADDSYRLSAWTSGAPDGSTVFFTVRQSALEVELSSSENQTRTTWSAYWDIPPEFTDGPAMVEAFLVHGNEILASASQAVTIMRSQDAVDVTWPRVDGIFGTYAALASTMPVEGPALRKDPAGVVDVLYTDSASISYVRAFYSTSSPGEAPVWIACGTEATTSSGSGNGLRCTMPPDDAARVSAIAAVANASPDQFEARFNGSGDAVVVEQMYEQEISTFTLGGAVFEKVKKEPNSERFYCSGDQVLAVRDQLGRGIAGANVDVEASGPTDALTFHAPSLLAVNQPPDRGGHRLEQAFDCTGEAASAGVPAPNSNPGRQGEHQRFGSPDEKHIETRSGGTNDLGEFRFKLRSPHAGWTSYWAWVDETNDGCNANDDVHTAGELSVTGSVGWAEDPGLPAIRTPSDIAPCGEPEPSPDPVPEPDGSRQVSLDAKRDGRTIALKGRITAAVPTCASLQHVALKVRRSDGRFKLVVETITSEVGRFRFERSSRLGKTYKAVAVKRGFCERSASAAVRVPAL